MAGDTGGKDVVPEPPLVARVGFFDETFFDLVPESSDDSPGHETQNSAGSTETVVEKCSDGTLFTHWKSTWEYNQSLTDVKRIELDEMVKNLRENPTMGTQDWEVITHCCMDDTEDNLFLVCYKMRGMTTRTIQLVKAMPYSHWETQKVAHDVKMKRGGWLCVVLQPHYMDGEESNVTTRWRYEVHKWYDRGRKFSSFFYSFDDCDYVPNSSDTRLWCEPVYLLRGDSFVYGPFSWSQKEKGKRPVEFRVDVKTWEEALPLILGRGTKEGSLFWRGFDDILLKQAGCGDEEIEGNKKKGRFNERSMRMLPVRYVDRDKAWKDVLPVCVRYERNEKFKFHKQLWENPDADENDEKAWGEKIGGLMSTLRLEPVIIDAVRFANTK